MHTHFLSRPFRSGMRMIAVVYTLVLLSGPAYGQQAKQEAVTPLILGEAHTLQSELLHEKRQLNIYLPPHYHSNDTARYPVIYLLDGGMDEDFIHVTGLVQFSSFPWVGRVPESIVVGIVNKDRQHDYTFPTTIAGDKAKFPTTGGSAGFISFVEKEVQPYINKRFRTSNSKTIIGESLGGLLAAEILLRKPYLFNTYIIISPSIWWDNGSLLSLPLSQLSNPALAKTKVYIAVGKEGQTPGDKPRIMEDDARLLKERILQAHSKNIEIFFDYLPDEDHATIAHHALLNAFKRLGK